MFTKIFFNFLLDYKAFGLVFMVQRVAFLNQIIVMFKPYASRFIYELTGHTKEKILLH